MKKVITTCAIATALFAAMFSPRLVTMAEEAITIEAEEGILTGTQKESSTAGFSGTGYVSNFDKDGDAVEVTANMPSDGLYNLTIHYSAPFGEKTANLSVNSEPQGGIIMNQTNEFADVSAGKVMLKAGKNTIKIEKGWGWYYIDYFKLEASSNAVVEHKVTSSLVNPNATKEAKAVMDYLVSMYGKKIISGQQSPNAENFISTLGKAPAIGGFDLMEYTPSRVEHGSTSNATENAIEWAKKGGLVTVQWHWNAPTKLIDKQGKEWWRGFYTDATDFDIEYALNNPESDDYKLLLRDIDVIAFQLKKLQDAGVPVMWRPLHEAEGKWFWWGAKGPEPCKKLYVLLYDRLTNYHKLNNLIWVWNSIGKDWYPGDQYVDIISYDSYPKEGDFGPVINQYDTARDLGQDKKLVAMSENGSSPDPEKLQAFRADWSWFCSWGNDLNGEFGNNIDHVKKVYSSDYVVTLDQLPKLYEVKEADSAGVHKIINTVVAYKNIINDIKGKNTEVQFINDNITWSFKGTDIKTSALSDVDLTLRKVNDYLKNNELKKAQKDMGKDTKIYSFSFNQIGSFPGKATIKLPVVSEWKNKGVNIYKYMNTKDTYEALGTAKVDSQGYLTLITDKGGDFFITEIKAEAKSGAVKYVAAVLMLVVVGFGSVVFTLKKKKA